ncbi:MAG: type II secretion system GspH family protein [Deltaproteobacteria bacterium]|nr:type II secretion system GspH family protein [Deltaproteobacteria bacterium]
MKQKRTYPFSFNHLRRRRKQLGVTLVEIMIVVIIMAMIAAAVGVAVLPRLNEARIEQARTDAHTIRSVVEMYLAQRPNADCPTVEDLAREKFLSAQARTTDPWDRPFSIECEGDEVVVISAGPDGQIGTADDIR